MHYILIIFMSGGYYGNSPSGFSTEFSDVQSCQIAFRSYVSEIYKLVRTPTVMTGVCVPKGKETK